VRSQRCVKTNISVGMSVRPHGTIWLTLQILASACLSVRTEQFGSRFKYFREILY